MSRPARVVAAIGPQLAAVDAGIAEIADRQWGVVSRRQLLALGLTAKAIQWRVSHGRLHPVHRGVYAVGYRQLSRHGWLMAAVLAAGESAVLSHRSAGAAWGLRPSERTRIEVTTDGGSRSRPGIQVYGSALRDDERSTKDGIPITTAARTLLDLAAVLQPAQLQRAIERAEALRLTDRTPLDELLTRYPNRRGTRALREVLRAGVHADRTRNDFERDFLAFLEAYGLPRPVVNGLVEGFEVDFHWPAQRLIVEVDGRETHDTSAAFERDRERDRKLVAAGWRPTRLTWRQFTDDAPAVAEDLASALSLRPSAPRAPRPATPSRATDPASGRGRTRGRSPSSRSSS